MLLNDTPTVQATRPSHAWLVGTATAPCCDVDHISESSLPKVPRRRRLRPSFVGSDGRRRLASVANRPAREPRPSAISAISYLCCGTQNAPATCAEKHIRAWLMRLIYVPHERLGRHVSGADFHRVDVHRRRLGSGDYRFKHAVLLAQASHWSSPRWWRCRSILVPGAGTELTLRRPCRNCTGLRPLMPATHLSAAGYPR